MSPVHQVWPKPSCKAQWNGQEDKADRGRGRKTTSGNGQARSSLSPRGQQRTGKSGGNWLQNHLWCPNDPRGSGIDDDDDDDDNDETLSVVSLNQKMKNGGSAGWLRNCAYTYWYRMPLQSHQPVNPINSGHLSSCAACPAWRVLAVQGW